MKTFDQLLAETTKNLFIKDKEQRLKYADEVFDLLQKAYVKAGGIKGSGFNSPEDMVNNIDMWKLAVVDDRVVAVFMYKSREGRKKVAGGFDRTSSHGKKEYYRMLGEEFKMNRSYGEVSGDALGAVQKMLGSDFEKIKIPFATAQKLMPSDELTDIDGFMYSRDINGERKEKMMIGNPNAPKIEVF